MSYQVLHRKILIKINSRPKNINIDHQSLHHHEKGFLDDLDFPFDPAINFIAYSLSWCDILCLSSISNVGMAYSTLNL